ncbi:MAG: DUF945 family protein [Halomonas sp.]|nr:DUF945 family protein [Halomonas sp.]
MRKTGWTVVAVLVLGMAGYLAAQAYSSQVFERELVRTLETLRADSRWRVERESVERGWFHSSGRLLISPAEEEWQARLPYDARHGVLSTRLAGALQVALPGDDGARQLFGDVLPSAEPRWTATFDTLEQRGEGRLDVAGFELARDAASFSFTGAEFTVEGRAGDVYVQGQVAPLHWQHDGEEVVTGPLHLNSRYQFEGGQPGDGAFFHQRNELILERLDYQGPRRAPITLTGLRYSDETRLDEQLRLDASLSLEQARLAGKDLLSGRLEASLERIDGAAVRTLVARLDEAVEASGGDLAGLDEAQRRALLERLEPVILALLADSPHFTLEGMTLSSPMFGIDTRGHGELIFDGAQVEALSVPGLLRGDVAAWRKRLDGRFVWTGIPPLLALQLGMPMDTHKIEVLIEAGEVSVNGRAVPLPL